MAYDTSNALALFIRSTTLFFFLIAQHFDYSLDKSSTLFPTPYPLYSFGKFRLVQIHSFDFSVPKSEQQNNEGGKSCNWD